MADSEELRAFYLGGSAERGTVFDVWEKGGAQGDSVTPSTYSLAYRQWMVDLLRKCLDEHEETGLLSIGCGNAMIESELVAAGYRVLAVDALEEATELAARKGVEAVCADLRTWSPPPGPWTVVYADGVFGHIHDPAERLQPVLTRLGSWFGTPTGSLVVSNDGPRTSTDIEPHPHVPGFVWLSASYLSAQIEQAGFRDVSSATFTYERPLSGLRDRVIVTAHAPRPDDADGAAGEG